MPRPIRRPGVAPLEFVLVFPFLILLMTVGWYAASVGFTFAKTATEARRESWAKREQCDPGTPQDPKQKPLVSYVDTTVARDVPQTSPIDGSTLTTGTETGVTDKTWDHEQVPFERLPNVPIAAHQDRLEHIAQFIPTIRPFVRAVPGFALMDPRVNPRLIAYRLEAIPYVVQRPIALGTIGASVLPMFGAIGRLIQAAYSNWLMAPWYLYEASLITRGIKPALDLAALLFERP